MTDIYLREDLTEAHSTGDVPRREYDLIEFYKEVKERWEIVAVEFNEEGHRVSFKVREKEG